MAADPRSVADVPVWEGNVKSRFQNGTRAGLESKSPARIDQIHDRAIPPHSQRVKQPRLGLNPGFSRPSKPIGLGRAFSGTSEQPS